MGRGLLYLRSGWARARIRRKLFREPMGQVFPVLIWLNFSWRLPIRERSMNRFQFGISPVLAVQAFRVKGLSSFAPYTEDSSRSDGEIPPNDLTDNGRDFSFGYGARIGILWNPTSYLSVGAAYQSRIFMTEFDDYDNLFAEEGDFDIPAFHDSRPRPEAYKWFNVRVRLSKNLVQQSRFSSKPDRQHLQLPCGRCWRNRSRKLLGRKQWGRLRLGGHGSVQIWRAAPDCFGFRTACRRQFC